MPGLPAKYARLSLKQLGLSHEAILYLLAAGVATAGGLARLPATFFDSSGAGEGVLQEIRLMWTHLQSLRKPPSPRQKARTETAAAMAHAAPLLAAPTEPAVPITALGLSHRTAAALQTHGVFTLEQLLRLPLGELRRRTKLGLRYLKEVDQVLARHGHGPTGAHGPARVEPSEAPPQPPVLLPDEWGARPLEALGLSTRAYKVLKRAGVRTVGELNTLTLEQLMGLRHMGKGSVGEVTRYLEALRRKVGIPVSGSADPALLAMPIGDLLLPSRAVKILRVKQITTVGELCGLTVRQLLQVTGVGIKTIRETVRALDEWGLSLAPDMEGDPETASVEWQPQDFTTLQGWLDVCLGELRESKRRAVALQFGLYDGRPRSLGEAGAILGLSPQRVCQMQADALKQLRRGAPAVRLAPLGQFYASVMEQNGGICRVKELARALAGHYDAGNVNPVSFALLTLPLCTGLVDLRDDCWSTAVLSRERYGEYQAVLAAILTEFGHPLPEAELVALAARRLGGFTDAETPGLAACARTSRRFVVENGWCLLARWRRGVKTAWVLAALHAIGRPAHHQEVAAMLARIAPQIKVPGERSVYTMLQLSRATVFTGRATFGLKRWGSAPSTGGPDGSSLL